MLRNRISKHLQEYFEQVKSNDLDEFEERKLEAIELEETTEQGVTSESMQLVQEEDEVEEVVDLA